MPINTTNTATGILLTTFATDIQIKGIWTIFTLFFTTLIGWNELAIFIIFLWYFIDFTLWLVIAFKEIEFELSKFFKWASKILIYWIFLVIWLSLDTTLHTWSFFMSTMFAFITISDSISILRKIHKLWYSTPVFIEKYLLSYKKNLEDGKFMKK